VEGVFIQALGALVLLGISAASYRLHATDAPGSASGFCLGLLIGFTSGWAWVAELISFLILGSAATRYRYQFKLSIHAAEEKRGARGFRNVLANGAVAAVISVLNYLHPSALLAVLFVAAISSAAADTLATEIGLLSSSKPVLINRPSSTTPPGISGGVTALGEAAALLGALIMAVLAVSMGVLPVSPLYVSIAALAGFVGCNVDSLLGSTVQCLYSCAVCNGFTEKKVHCGQPTGRIKGLGPLGNNEVNLLSDLAAAFFAALLVSFF
jgi:uncharacterized protein (TIGR00297 family)